MKKLNKKGFTLIELLAVIVILAIIVVVTVPTILNSINDARLSSISSLSKEVANQYDTAVAQDLIATTQTLTAKATGEWKCINEVGNVATALDLSASDLVVTGTTISNLPIIASTGELDLANISATTCSAIRTKSNGSAEVLLVATDSGKFAVSGKVVYALSSAGNGVAK